MADAYRLIERPDRLGSAVLHDTTKNGEAFLTGLTHLESLERILEVIGADDT